MIVFLEVTPTWPIDAEPIRVVSAADARAQTWDGQRWAAALFDPGQLGISLFSGEIGTIIETSVAPVVIAEEALLESYPDAVDVRWQGASFNMWAGTFDTTSDTYPYANDVQEVAKGTVSRFEKDAGSLKLSLDPSGVAGDTKVLVREYAGTGGAEGGPDLKGTLKPWIFGHAKNVNPTLIDEDNSVYQFSGYGPIQSVDALYERGSSFGASIGNYANYAALVAATIPAGRWATCLAEGLIRLGAPQYGVITGDVKGDYAGSVQRRHPGAILQRIASERSISGDAIDSASLAALDAFAATLPDDGYMNIVLSDQTTFLELARRICAPYNAQAGFSLLGKLFACRIVVGTPTFTIDARGRRLPLVGAFVEADTPPPYKTIRMSGDISWYVNNLSTEIAFYAQPKERGIYDDDETYREGDIVSIPDGSRWIYSNPVPTSGNLPSDSSLYWSRLSSAVSGTPGADGVSNAVVYLYRRGATSPAMPTGTFTYTFATGILSGGSLNSWTQAIPAADGNPLWVIAATASAAAATDTIAAAEFAAPVLKDGAGLNTATVELYQRAASAPSVPAGTLTYTFSTASLSGTLGSWTQAAPAHDGNPLYKITATALGTGPTDTIATSEWSTPQIIASNGTDGTSPPLILVASTHQTFRYDTAGSPLSQTTTISATRQNTAGTTEWQLRKADGTVAVTWTTAAAMVTAGGADSSPNNDELVLNQARFQTLIAFLSTTGLIYEARMSGATSVQDRISIVKVQDGAAGAAGSAGAPGSPGANGITYYTWYAFADAPDGSFNFTTGAPGGRSYRGEAYNKTSPTESTNPADYVWSPYEGPPNFGLANFNSNTVLAGNKLIKIAGGTGWNASVHSTESFKGGAAVSFVIDTAASFMVGLNTDPTADADYTSLDFAIYIAGPTTLQVYESGSLAYSNGGATNNVGDVYTVTYNGKSVVYSRNGVAFYINNAPTPNLTLFVDSSFYTAAPVTFGRIMSFTGVGVPGTDGDDGANGLSIAASKPILTVARTPTGAPKSGELPKTTQMIVYDGFTDITASCTFSRTAYHCTASNDGGGAFTLTAISTDGGGAYYADAYFDVTAVAPDGRSITMRISTTAQKDGPAASRASASVTTMTNSGTFTQIAVVDIVAANGATITASAGVNYNAAFFSGSGTRTVNAQVKVSIQNLTDAGAESDGSSVVGSNASYIGGDGPSDVGSASAGHSVTNSSGGPKTFRCRFYLRKNSGTANIDTTGGTYAGTIEANVA